MLGLEGFDGVFGRDEEASLSFDGCSTGSFDLSFGSGNSPSAAESFAVSEQEAVVVDLLLVEAVFDG